MITIKNVLTLDQKKVDHLIQSEQDQMIDAGGRLTLFPALIDPHVHFFLSQEKKENWKTGALAALAGGVTTVFDIPDSSFSCMTKKDLEAKRKMIDKELEKAGLPLRYSLYLGMGQKDQGEIGLNKQLAVGVHIFIYDTAGVGKDLLIEDDRALEEIFRLAAQENVLLVVHAEDREVLEQNKKTFAHDKTPSVHSRIHERKAALIAVKKMIDLAEKYNAQLYFTAISTKEEVDLIRHAKQKGLLVFAEVTPQHLFLNEEDYRILGMKVKIDPPLRTKADQDALWEGIHEGVIDTIASDHFPYMLEEKNGTYEQVPSGVPGIETVLPLLLNAYHEKKITLEQIVKLTRINSERIFCLPPHHDAVLVDLKKTKELRNKDLKTKAGWTPFAGQFLTGWPVYTIAKGKLFQVESL